jgi:hypothetical protein
MRRVNGRRSAEHYTGAWLAMKLGVEPRLLDVRRRSGELLGVQAVKGGDYVYPIWQFAPDGRPRPEVARVIRAAREAGLRDDELHELLQRRDGMTGRGRLADALREGRADHVLQAIAAAARGR